MPFGEQVYKAVELSANLLKACYNKTAEKIIAYSHNKKKVRTFRIMQNTNNTKTITNLEEILYFLFFGLLFFAKGIGWYDGQPAFKAVFVVALFGLLMKACIGSYSLREIIICMGVVLLAGVTYLTSGDKGLVLYALMVVGIKNVNQEHLLKVALTIWSCAFGGVWLISLTHMENTMYRVVQKLGLEHFFRWSMGYAHPNVLHISYLIFAALVLLVLKERINWKHYAALAAGNLFVFLYSVSYTGVIIVFLLLAGRVYLQLRPKNNRFEKILLLCIYPFCLILSLLGPILLTGKAFEIVNKILNTRLFLSKHYLTAEYISPFGRRIADITSPHWAMDNSYVYGFIAYGMIPFAILSIAFLWLLVRLLKQNRMLEVLIILVFAVAGLTEPFLFNTSFKNLCFVFMGYALFEALAKDNAKEICIWKKGNKEITLDMPFLHNGKEKAMYALLHKRGTIAVGMLMGMLLAAVIYGTQVQPSQGYIAERSHCESISEDITHYADLGAEYDGYQRMKDFAPEEEVEVFTGDIVMVEQVRGVLMSVLLGGLAGCLVMIAVISWRGKK